MKQASYSELYQKTILAYNKSPKNFGKITGPCYEIHGQNQMCGDYLSLYLVFDDKKTLDNISFEGEGCAILMASASMMTELLKGKNMVEIDRLMIEFRKILNGELDYSQILGELNIFSGLAQFQSRIKCALLAWDTLIEGVEEQCQKCQ